MLSLKAVDAGYDDALTLRGVSLEVERGEIVAMIGANGAGKSTTLRTICGFLRPRKGAIEFDGRTISGLTPDRITAMAAGLREVAALPEPIGRLIDSKVRPNGLRIDKVGVPLGVILFIYESRPNVTVDAAGLSVKAGDAIILRGGKEAMHSKVPPRCPPRYQCRSAGAGVPIDLCVKQ